jgi:hypothetical protein
MNVLTAVGIALLGACILALVAPVSAVLSPAFVLVFLGGNGALAIALGSLVAWMERN